MSQIMDESIPDIDDSLYSRQRYVLGDRAMQRLAGANVFLSGLGGVGVEIAKNIILAGVKSITLQDHRRSTFLDLGVQFYLNEEDVKQKRNRAQACFKKLAELNPYVSVETCTENVFDTDNLSFLNKYQVVIMTEASLDDQIKINKFCRRMSPQIKFLSADVYGLFCWSFGDFGDQFEVTDTNGEEPKEVFISKIARGPEGLVTTFDNKLHGLETADCVTFKEVKGMTEVNGKDVTVKVINPTQFSISDTSSFAEYESGGIVSQIKKPVTFSFKSMEEQLFSPDFLVPDLCKFEAPMNIHLGMLAFNHFLKVENRLPNIRCSKDGDLLVKMAEEFNRKLATPLEKVDSVLIALLSKTCQGQFAPLCAFLGGAVAQEALKAVTGKFSPLKQWLHLDTAEVATSDGSPELFMPRQDRYDSLRICLGQQFCEKLASLKLFMVGCGAIGCEMLKNYAVLGIGAKGQGRITITDNDLIEKSNLNRQFLFRPQHIRQPKSTTAAKSTVDINPHLSVDAHQHKVCPQTEASVYNDAFFTAQDIVVNALDNLEARRYMDSRCVTNQRALVESGTMGAKGHVQIIVPHLNESYSSQRDPVDDDVPFCTLKSFPAQIEHCIQWARDKFESSFAQKPALFSKFWSTNGLPQDVLQTLSQGSHLEGCVQVCRLISTRPRNTHDCIALARLKFEKYFNHKAKNLLHAFPLDTKLSDGGMFWQSPKRPPVPVEFSVQNQLHLSFVRACARLYADISGIRQTNGDFEDSVLMMVLGQAKVPEFRPSSKKIETDESAKREEKQEELQDDDLQQAASRIKAALGSSAADLVFQPMNPLMFEKDDDENGHIDFVTAASNLRAAMYNLEPADRLKTKRIAGRIVPAIATTTAAVAGLATIELVKVVFGCKLGEYRNTFLNLALPLFVLSEPGVLEKKQMSCGVSFSIWDRWDVYGNKEMTLAHFMQEIKNTYNVNPSMVVQGSKMVYVPIMPMHKKRLPQTMMKLLKPAPGNTYVDLVVSFMPTSPDAEDEMGPSVRYYFGS